MHPYTLSHPAHLEIASYGICISSYGMTRALMASVIFWETGRPGLPLDGAQDVFHLPQHLVLLVGSLPKGGDHIGHILAHLLRGATPDLQPKAQSEG